jgi:DNA-binding MarR family transcriptional regulator
MTDFSVGENGLMVERSIHDLAEWYARLPDGTNPLNYEAHVMLLRAYTSLVAQTAGTGIPRAWYNVLRILYQQPDRRMQMTDISIGLNISATNITKVVHGLEQAGLVRRVPHEEDKRRTWSELTPAGEAEFLRAVPLVFAHTNGIWDDFSDSEKQIFVHVLAKLRMLLLARASGDELSDFKPPVPRRRRSRKG